MGKEILKVIGAGVAGGLAVLVGQQVFSPLAQISRPSQQTPTTLQQSVRQDTNISFSFQGYDKNIPPVFSYLDNWNVSFDDNFSPGMQAYFIDKQTGKESRLPFSYARKKYAMFTLPGDIRTHNRQFEVYATDRDGNVSPRTSCYSLDGVLLLAEAK